MVKGYWYLVAIGITISLISKMSGYYFLFILFALWLVYLYTWKGIHLYLLFLTISTSLFFLYYVPSTQQLMSQIDLIDLEITEFTGKINGPISQTDKTIQFSFQDNRFTNTFNVVYFKDSTHKDDKESIQFLKYGAYCDIYGVLEIPEKATNPHQFDYQMFLLKKGISHQLIVDTISDIRCEQSSPFQFIYDIRNNLLHTTEDKLQAYSVAWLHALVLGDDSSLDDKTIELFQRWSLSHILAISGLHIGIVVGILYYLFVRFSLATVEKAQWIVMLFLPIYALLAGGAPSVWRASIMVLFVIIMNKIKWKFSYADVISIVFILLIFLNKLIIYHVGFQLSFAVTFGLIISRKWIGSSESRIIQLLKISFISQMIILPLQIHYFFIFQPLSIILNVIVVPYFSLFVIPSMFFLLVSIYLLPSVVISLFESIFIYLNEMVFSFIYFVDKYVNYPFIIGTFPIAYTIIYYIIFICFMIALEAEDKQKAFKFGLLICLLLIVLKVRPYLSNEETVTMLDIGQGDAFVIELPYRKGVFLIDAGATVSFHEHAISDKVYRQVIKPYLYGRGIQKIDTIFLSHEHADHFGSVEFIVNDLKVDEIVISPYYELEQEWETKWTFQNTTIKRVLFNEKVEINGQTFHVTSPYEDKYDANENSLVLYTHLGGLSWLFTGDIGKITEKEILHHFDTFEIDVLKVGHHGSNTSTEPAFISSTKPTYAFIPVGVNNRYNHPNEEVIATLMGEEITIFRTDIHGAVQYRYRNNKGYFTIFLNK